MSANWGADHRTPCMGAHMLLYISLSYACLSEPGARLVEPSLILLVALPHTRMRVCPIQCHPPRTPGLRTCMPHAVLLAIN